MPDDECSHVWNSVIGYPARVVECDWCIRCSTVRPGYGDPRDKWKEEEET